MHFLHLVHPQAPIQVRVQLHDEHVLDSTGTRKSAEPFQKKPVHVELQRILERIAGLSAWAFPESGKDRGRQS